MVLGLHLLLASLRIVPVTEEVQNLLMVVFLLYLHTFEIPVSTFP